jgi:uncharacterized protein (UPF0332 family)
MSFDWQKYLVLADSLYQNCGASSNEEACLRAAISRGYYAAFCTARNFARDNDNLHLSNTGRDHKFVKEYYYRSPDSKRRKIGLLLDRLRDKRNKADYADTEPQLEENTRYALNVSHEIIKLLQAIYTK